MKTLNHIFVVFALFTMASCDLEEMPVDTATNQAIFESVGGLELYSNSFYDILPSTDVGVFQRDDLSDLVARNGVDDFLTPNALSPITSGGWDWKDLRNINYFIENANKSAVANKNHFVGVARFFRALFYFEKVKRFGDVPWVDQTIAIDNDAVLYAKRDDRFLVMDKVLADLDYAIEHIELTTDPSATRITKSVARAYKTRICLHEASFRKYHVDYNKQSTAQQWYREVFKEANAIAGFVLHKSSDVEKSYRELFIAKTPFVDETLLAVVLNANLQVFSSANRRFISPTYGNRPSLTRDFVKMYLNADGSRFTDDPNYKTKPFVDEVKNRDLRLKQTIRSGNYARTENGVPVISAPNFTQTYTGYQPIKWCYDERFPYDDESRNDNAHIIMRWGEILLNKAEALAELGEMTPSEWNNTIAALRERAGIPAGAARQLPTVADPYLLNYYKGRFSDPILLEIIRERAVEMIFEGLRTDDLIRWRLGELFQTSAMNGMYVPGLGEYDLNGDGRKDVYFYQGQKPTSSTAGIAFVNVSPSTSVGQLQLSNGTSGEVLWNPGVRKWEDRKYLYPIPQNAKDRNNNLGQNKGWE
ncbi:MULTISPECIES: RagB/SusD family nutrient uptake outer membrane protein [Sphingobacterium]|uniref:RagB/SusD family nutrient uptake outer membrane protein n=1 Tax=Sphingobacterium TaxID=28453 RepID=UPI0013DD6C52|nr:MULTISPECIES: RagB/SusD family nutrient uptake outer membrane protein [unclassified Sphingobacterium]